jgi:hypothetical protein
VRQRRSEVRVLLPNEGYDAVGKAIGELPVAGLATLPDVSPAGLWLRYRRKALHLATRDPGTDRFRFVG